MRQKYKKNLLLIGGGGHCKSCIDVIEQTEEFNIVGILDDDPIKQDKEILGYKIIGTTKKIKDFKQNNLYGLITVGQIKKAEIRNRFYKELLRYEYNIPTIISKHSYVSKYAFVDEGSIVMNGVFINAGARIGKNCIINTKAIIEHDVKIGKNCHISTGAVINGDVLIKDSSFIGSNATVVESIEIERNSFIKAGSLVK